MFCSPRVTSSGRNKNTSIDFFFIIDRKNDSRDETGSRSPEGLMSVFNRSSVVFQMVRKNASGTTDRPTDKTSYRDSRTHKRKG